MKSIIKELAKLPKHKTTEEQKQTISDCKKEGVEYRTICLNKDKLELENLTDGAIKNYYYKGV